MALKNMPQDQRQPFLQAAQLYSEDVDGAVAALQPIVDSGHADVYVAALLGSILTGAKRWQGAADAYQAARRAVGPSPNSFPWNLEEGLGEALLNLQRYPEAALHLERSLPFPGNEEAYGLYELVGQAYEGAGEPALAIQAYAYAVCIHPFSDQIWHALNRANQTRGSAPIRWSSRLAYPPKQVRFEDMAVVARAVASSPPLSNVGRLAYVRIADALYQADQVKGGTASSCGISRLPRPRMAEAKICLNVEKTMALMDSLGYLPHLTPGTRYHLLSLLVSDQTAKADYGPALATFRTISKESLTADQKADMNDLLKRYYKELLQQYHLITPLADPLRRS